MRYIARSFSLSAFLLALAIGEGTGDDGLDRLNRHHRLRVSGRQGVHVGEDEVAGAVVVEGGFVFFADDGEGIQHVLRVFPCQAVEVEVERFETGA